MNRRAELLRQLAEFREPLDALLTELRKFPFDWEGEPLLVLTRDHFMNVMSRYLDGSLSAAQLQDWAECLECRDDVGFESARSKTLEEMQFWLANPDINGEITPELITHLRDRLRESRV